MKIFELQKVETRPYRPLELFEAASKFKEKTFLEPVPSHVLPTTGYLNYLAEAWADHYAVVLTPSDLWYMIVCELATAIKKLPKTYESMFTTTPDEKQLLLVPTGTVEEINPALVINELKNRVPSRVDDFLPQFSTNTPIVTMAMHVAFCDMVSPFYNYGTFLCGFPHIEIGGSGEDWRLLEEKLYVLKGLFKGSLQTYLERCWGTTVNLIAALKGADTKDFLNKMVRLTHCGSGHQYEMNGWIIHFLNRKDYTKAIQLEGLPVHTSVMKYKNMDTGRKFSLSAGIFYSVVDGYKLTPVYNAYREEFTKAKYKQSAGESIAAKIKKFAQGPSAPPTVVSTPIEPQRSPGGIWMPKIEAGPDVVSPNLQNMMDEELVSNRTCPKCRFQMEGKPWDRWAHKLCPNCAYTAVQNVLKT